MRIAVQILVTTCLVFQSSCEQEAKSPSGETGQEEFDKAITELLARPLDSFKYPDPDVLFVQRLSCASPKAFDHLIDRLAEAPNFSMLIEVFGYGSMHLEDCALGEAYVEALTDRLIKEERPKHRKTIRDGIQWHAFHKHALSWTEKTYESSVAGKARRFERRDKEDDRWYGVVQAIYAPRYREAAAEMWRAIRADAEVTDNLLVIGALETSFNRLDASPYRSRFLAECLKLLEEARALESPTAAEWMIKYAFPNFIGRLNSREVLEWESALLESAMKARSQAHRGDAINALFSLGSLRVESIVNEWLKPDLSEPVVEGFVSGIPLHRLMVRDRLPEIDHPRVRAWMSIQSELRRRELREETSVDAWLSEVIRKDPDEERRRAALEALLFRVEQKIRNDPAAALARFKMAADVLNAVSKDPSLRVRKVLIDALKNYEEHFEGLGAEVAAVLRRFIQIDK